MKAIFFYIFVFVFFTTKAIGQNRILNGRILDQFLVPIPTVKIQTQNALISAETDFDGRFSITIPNETEKLFIKWIGIEDITIQLLNDCDNLEIIALDQGTYDFMSNRKVDRLRFKQFQKIPDLHRNAFQKGLFLSEKPCYRREFEAIKPELDEIKRNRKKTSP